VAPTVALLLVLTVLPVLNLIALSFNDVAWLEGTARWTWVGTHHYAALPADQLFICGVFNTIVFALSAVVGQIILGFVLALLVSRTLRGRVVYRAIFLLPILVPGIVIGAMWKLMYNFDFGVINQLATMVAIAPRDWLGGAPTALLAVIFVDIWHWTPFCFLLLLTGLETLPQDVHEAARVDGATWWQELWHVTLPLMLPTILVTLVFRLIVAFKVFDEVYLLTGGGPGMATEVLSFTIYRRFFTEDRVGYGSAVSVVALSGITLFIVLALAATRRQSEDG
jgi:multiple sugar transport system permease protein